MAGTVASEIEDKDAGRGGTTTGCYIVTALIFFVDVRRFCLRTGSSSLRAKRQNHCDYSLFLTML